MIFQKKFLTLISTLSAIFFLGITCHAKSWKQWYRIYRDNKPMAAYREEIEWRPKEKQWAINQRWWEKMSEYWVDDLIIGAVVDQEFLPIAFHVERKGQHSWKSIEGKSKAKKLLVKLKMPGKNKKAIELNRELNLEKEVTFSSFTNIYIREYFDKHPNKKSFQVNAIIEEGENGKFYPTILNVTVLDSFIMQNKKKCDEFLIVFNGMKTNWWIEKSGKLCKMYNSSQKILLESTNNAKGFLISKP